MKIKMLLDDNNIYIESVLDERGHKIDATYISSTMEASEFVQIGVRNKNKPIVVKWEDIEGLEDFIPPFIVFFV